MDVDFSTQRRVPSLWLGHLLVFGLLFALVVSWFFVQTRQAQQVFLEDASTRARLLTDAVLLHTQGAVLAEQVLADILTRFLGNSARFVMYLDGVAPFRADELTAFAEEAGLSVIHLIRAEDVVQGPPGWQPSAPLDCQRLEQLIRLPEVHTIVFGVAAPPGCVLVGLDSRHTEALEAAIGLPSALAAVAQLPGVVKVQLAGTPRALTIPPAPLPPITMRQLADGRTVAHAVAAVAGTELMLDLDAGSLLTMRRRLWWQFLGFMLALGSAAGVGGWLLYRHQRGHERQRLAYERQLSRQREEASLGRAAAAIAHEIRNPLNAMAMGLQRLQWEADGLQPEHRRLLEIVLAAVERTNKTVTGLLDYARPLRPQVQRLALDVVVREQVSLYQHQIELQATALHVRLQPHTWINGDPDLLRQVLDNLLRNALETAAVGVLEIEVSRVADSALLRLSNDGLELAASEVENILEPWFTTKPLGTGLGMAISQRIITAHGGQLTLTVPQPGRLCVAVALRAATAQSTALGTKKAAAHDR
ncbi:two-component sensor histidine kinase [Chromatium okenii]|nr:ATP-binding protein [Chromatium okenii]MBK1641126.1 two-component sensor histidine kinase [Chromatium okenii]